MDPHIPKFHACVKATFVLIIILNVIVLLTVFGVNRTWQRTPKIRSNNTYINISSPTHVITSTKVPDFQVVTDDPLLCPRTPPGLVGSIAAKRQVIQESVLDKRYTPSRPGGHFKPSECLSRTRTAVIVSYRDRERHLLVLLNNLIPFLMKQQAEFAIFVVEPVARLTFNRALLMNVGFVEALKTNTFDCFIFHDVDLIPVNDKNLYRCGKNPRHMSVANSKFRYGLPYKEYAGGVLAMSRSIYENINGQSNLYFGWGGEDDDVFYRFKRKNYTLVRYPMLIGRYEALGHDRDKGNPTNPRRVDLLTIKRTKKDSYSSDGLNTLKYKIVKKENRPLYTWILVDLDMTYYNKALAEVLHHV